MRIIGDVPLLEVKEGLVAHVTEGRVHALHERVQCKRVVYHVFRKQTGVRAQVEVLEALHANGLIPLRGDLRFQFGLLRPRVVPLNAPVGVGVVFGPIPAVPLGVAPSAWRN